jgi:hypothetical protein
MSDSNPSVARALVNPVGIGVAAGAATVAIALTNPLIGIVGGGVYLATVALDAFRRSRKKRKKTRQANVFGMKDPDDIHDESTRNAVKKIAANRASLQRVLDETPEEIKIGMKTTLDSLDELERHAVRLVERAEDITTHLSKVNLPALVTEVKQLATRAATAKDLEARKSFDEAKTARMDEIRALKELRATKERIDANLMRVVAILGSLPTKVVQLRALDAQAMDQASGDIQHDLDAIGKELEISEQVVRQQLVVAQ